MKTVQQRVSVVLLLIVLQGCTASRILNTEFVPGDIFKTEVLHTEREVKSVSLRELSPVSVKVTQDVDILEVQKNYHKKIQKSQVEKVSQSRKSAQSDLVLSFATFGLWIPYWAISGSKSADAALEKCHRNGLIFEGAFTFECLRSDERTEMPGEIIRESRKVMKQEEVPVSTGFVTATANNRMRVKIPINADGVAALDLLEIPDAMKARAPLHIEFTYGDALVTTSVSKKEITRVFSARTPPKLTASVKLSEPSGNNMLDGGEQVALLVSVNNSGTGNAYDVHAKLGVRKGGKEILFDSDVPIGTIPAGRSVTKEVILHATKSLPEGSVSFDIQILEANGFDADPVRIAFKTRAFEPPVLAIADVAIADGSGNSRVEPMEMVEVTARLQNTGQGDARNVQTDVVGGPNVFFAEGSNRHFAIETLRPGEFRDLKFIFYANKRIENGREIPLELRISEDRAGLNLTRKLGLVMSVPQKNVRELVVEGIETARVPVTPAPGLSVDVDTAIPRGEKAGHDDIAVVIGNRNYGTPGVPAVEFAERDARVIREYLKKTFGFRPGNIIYEENATLSKFNEIFGTGENPTGRLFDYVKAGVSSVFIYYAGHGAPDLQSHEAYFMPVDANPQYIASNGYSLSTFYANLARVPAKTITIVLDSCFSGNSGDKKLLFKDISPAIVKVRRDYRGPENATVFSSANVDQVSSWYPEKKHSLFTYYFLKAVQGAADENKDSNITLGEIKKYLSENVPYMARRLNAVKQDPVIVGDENELFVQLK